MNGLQALSLQPFFILGPFLTLDYKLKGPLQVTFSIMKKSFYLTGTNPVLITIFDLRRKSEIQKLLPARQIPIVKQFKPRANL